MQSSLCDFWALDFIKVELLSASRFLTSPPLLSDLCENGTIYWLVTQFIHVGQNVPTELDPALCLFALPDPCSLFRGDGGASSKGCSTASTEAMTASLYLSTSCRNPLRVGGGGRDGDEGAAVSVGREALGGEERRINQDGGLGTAMVGNIFRLWRPRYLGRETAVVGA